MNDATTIELWVERLLPDRYIGSPAVELALLAAVLALLGAALLRVTRLSGPLARARGRMAAAAYGMLVYRRCPRAVIGCQLSLIWANLQALACLSPVILLFGAIFAIAWGPLCARYEHEPLRVGQEFIVSVRLAPNNAAEGLLAQCDLVASPAEAIQLVAVARVRGTSTLWVRLVAARPGIAQLTVTGTPSPPPLLKAATVNVSRDKISPRPRQLLPGADVRISYPTRRWFGMRRGWVAYFVACSCLFCWPVSRLLRRRDLVLCM